MESPSVTPSHGGSFLIEDLAAEELFTPEDFTDEQRHIARTANLFMQNEVVPHAARIISPDFELSRRLLRKAGDLGLLGAEIPEEHGGLGLGKVAGCIVAEAASHEGSFAVALVSHTGIGTVPIVYFGTEEQKRRYLPKLSSGEWVGSYSLSETSSASDAMNAKARATLSPDGRRYVLNGEKMWLTNAAIADIYITFAKVDGEHFSAFIIDKGTPGVSLGPEERKTGIRGSSTRSLILADASVPRENLLGPIGKGHKVAFNTLNLGRFKLGAGVTGGAKLSLRAAVEFARARTAFGRPLTDFGLIRHKLGEMAILAYAAEAMVYRTAAAIDRGLAALPKGEAQQAVGRIEEHDVECSIVKVWCSEMLDTVVDETVQIFGGSGYVEDYPAERHWRDARVNRIFEGTNEINRLLIPGRLIKRAIKGELPIFRRAMALLDELVGGPSAPAPLDGFLAAEGRMLTGAKKVALMALGLAVQRLGQSLSEEQEVLGHFADIAMEAYALESALLRAQKKAGRVGAAACRVEDAAVRCFAQDAMDRLEASARRLLAAVEQGDGLRTALAALRRFTKREIENTVALRRIVAQAAVERGGFPFA